MLFENLWTLENAAALVTLTAMELVLGIDNIVFIAIVSGRLPAGQREKARRLGLFGAMFLRIALLLTIAAMMRLTAPLFHLLSHPVSGRDLILLAGGLFLIAKATHEIHNKLEGTGEEAGRKGTGKATFGAVIFQILVLDLVFSIDSIITAVGMARHVGVMIVAIVLAVGAMMLFAGAVSAFIDRHPTLKMLALSFLLLIGVMLVAEGFGKHIERGYIYFAMGFSLFVELLNLKVRRASGT
ncbi:Membrane protein TerC, possibly involved in tellurium resistance [Desulfacinum infernum DSM 9756]|uniref:Membrane protein TerC, possibly involved in tellurium resistance n=1 Tax=Desulfacinum infernum DSM 9756 TaxID=1121391 RepID=A0A1M5D893_9BACT|nr:TerC family protein [Desulfacinum infernum]SHF63107.1 Membrane protein TerC, possibly involved in tellurium resistance [Desulfacinum infernum DSM 9756]